MSVRVDYPVVTPQKNYILCLCCAFRNWFRGSINIPRKSISKYLTDFFLQNGLPRRNFSRTIETGNVTIPGSPAKFVIRIPPDNRSSVLSNHPRALSLSRVLGSRAKGKQDGQMHGKLQCVGVNKGLNRKIWKKYYIFGQNTDVTVRYPKGSRRCKLCVIDDLFLFQIYRVLQAECRIINLGTIKILFRIKT